jgi:hypothetical protein
VHLLAARITIRRAPDHGYLRKAAMPDAGSPGYYFWRLYFLV